MPKIGDMIIETSKDTGQRYVGLVVEIQVDDWGHQTNVMIEWSGKSPKFYHNDRGYHGVNIHNIRSRYEVIRGGIKIQ